MRFVPFVLIALFLSACVSPEEVSNIKTDVTSVYKEFSADKQQKSDELSKIEKDVENLRKQLSDLSVSLEARDERIKIMAGKIDELESQLKTYWEETKGELKDLRRGGSREREPVHGQSGAGRQPVGDDQYKEAFGAFQKGSYQEAAAKFSDFTRTAPDHPLAPNAFYWIGESCMNLKDYEKAIVAFQEIAEKHPTSDKAPKALMRQGEAFAALGDKKSANTMMKRVVELYPKTEEARVAERMIKSGGFR